MLAEARGENLGQRLDRFCHSRYMRNAMKRIRRIVHLGVSLVAFSAYASAANHCAFVPIDAEDEHASSQAHIPAHEDCPGHDSPEEGDTQCCKGFPTAWIPPAKALVAIDAFSFANHSYFAAAEQAAEQLRAELHPLELDTGPPFATSFVECVLQRSILAHAPPFSLS